MNGLRNQFLIFCGKNTKVNLILLVYVVISQYTFCSTRSQDYDEYNRYSGGITEMNDDLPNRTEIREDFTVNKTDFSDVSVTEFTTPYKTTTVVADDHSFQNNNTSTTYDYNNTSTMGEHNNTSTSDKNNNTSIENENIGDEYDSGEHYPSSNENRKQQSYEEPATNEKVEVTENDESSDITSNEEIRPVQWKPTTYVKPAVSSVDVTNEPKSSNTESAITIEWLTSSYQLTTRPTTTAKTSTLKSKSDYSFSKDTVSDYTKTSDYQTPESGSSYALQQRTSILLTFGTIFLATYIGSNLSGGNICF